MAAELHIRGGSPLVGEITIDSSKNALLPIIAASILTEGVTRLCRVPRISDIDNLLKILISLGIKPRFENGDLLLDTTEIRYNSVSPETASKIRGSIFVLGAILGRFKSAEVPYPGGCAIGGRPIDIHLAALRQMDVIVREENGIISCKRRGSKTENARVFLDFPSVGATENVIMASVLGGRRVVIENAAIEPEVADLCNFLIACGASICGVGTNRLTITGVKKLVGANYTAIPDRINTGSFLIATAACGGNVILKNTIPAHNANLISKLRHAGCDISADTNSVSVGQIQILAPTNARLRAFGSVHTAPFPGFPTDLQSQLAALASICRGNTTITENLFENRFKHMAEIAKLGGKFCIREKQVSIQGVSELANRDSTDSPVHLNASDLRGGVALVIAALSAQGPCIIHNADFVYRGHAEIEQDLIKLGANILRVDTPNK
jgi:UDP-N-acetylglucosamine 1-carboxyvinyltransferase